MYTTITQTMSYGCFKMPFLGWQSNYEGRLKSSWTGGSAPLLCRGKHNSITVAHCHQSMNLSNGPRSYI
jgi:hypothetical protein